jgi:hypothetical protein
MWNLGHPVLVHPQLSHNRFPMDDGILDENLDALIGCQVVSYNPY